MPPVDLNESAVLTLHEVAAYLNCSYSTVARLARQGKIPCFRLGGLGDWRLLKSELNKWMAKAVAHESHH